MRLATAAANGTTTPEVIQSPGHAYKSHLYTLYVYGTFDSANVEMQASPDNKTTFFKIPDADLITTKTMLNLEFRATHIQAVITGGLGSEAIDIILF